MENNKLTKEERVFCELYATGDIPFAGDAALCYREAFGYDKKDARLKALKLISEQRIQKYLEEIELLSYEEAKYMKKFLTHNLMSIVTECSREFVRDRRGTKLSPAPLRSVAVNASKTLMEMYPIKEANKLNIEGSDGEGITFNLIVPEKKTEDK